MAKLWNFLQQERNRQILGWIGGGLVVVAGGIWAVFIFLWTPSSGHHEEPKTNIEAKSGGVAIGGDVSGSTITAGKPADAASPKP